MLCCAFSPTCPTEAAGGRAASTQGHTNGTGKVLQLLPLSFKYFFFFAVTKRTHLDPDVNPRGTQVVCPEHSISQF